MLTFTLGYFLLNFSIGLNMLFPQTVTFSEGHVQTINARNIYVRLSYQNNFRD